MSSKKGLGFSRKTESCLDFNKLNLNFEFEDSESHLSARNLMNQIREGKNNSKSSFQKNSSVNLGNLENKNNGNSDNTPCIIINYCDNN